jgi:hypothetical protein
MGFRPCPHPIFAVWRSFPFCREFTLSKGAETPVNRAGVFLTLYKMCSFVESYGKARVLDRKKIITLRGTALPGRPLRTCQPRPAAIPFARPVPDAPHAIARAAKASCARSAAVTFCEFSHGTPGITWSDRADRALAADDAQLHPRTRSPYTGGHREQWPARADRRSVCDHASGPHNNARTHAIDTSRHSPPPALPYFFCLEDQAARPNPA